METKTSGTKPAWAILGMMAVPFLLVVFAAFASPDARDLFLRAIGVRRHSCRGSLETNAVGSCRAYSSAQTMYKRNDWDGDGTLEYAKKFPMLANELDGNGNPIQLLDAAFASAKGINGIPKHGYLFKEMKTIGGVPIDWQQDYALCAIPSTYGRTGYRSFMVSTNGTIFGMDQGQAGTFVSDYPTNPTAAGWIIAE